WWIPALGGKTDAIPGDTNHTWFNADPGTYKGRCAEFCGLLHAAMASKVQVLPAAQFQTWLKQRASNPVAAGLGRETFQGTCAKCHGMQGQGGVGPALTGNPLITQRAGITALLEKGGATMPPVGRGWPKSQLNALSYWLFVFGGIVLYASWFSSGGPPKAGWTSYVPLSVYSKGTGEDLWILSLHILTLASLAGAINFLATIANMRTRGMSWMRMPLFVWSIFTYSLLLVLVLPALSAGLTLLLLDRQAGTHFFIPSHGGSALLWQHVFWFFGHPEVYIMILPAMGIISEVIPVFSRKPIFGYTA